MSRLSAFRARSCPERWRFWYSLNPVVGVIDGFRWCLLGGQSQLYLPGFLVSLGVVAFFLWFGIRYFRRTERTFADHGADVMSDVVIRAEGLGKKYLIGHESQRERYTALRDVIGAHGARASRARRAT